MARSVSCWGIDIGKCALKAVRCSLSSNPRKVTADAFDYIEYPMLLTQPESDPVELVRGALAEFVGRNKLKGSRVAISVPGQSGLSKFIKLPPIEAKKIPDIVKYEARQQIPFPLEQVVWDWQRLAGGIDEGGFVIDAEVAVFAMKREQVFKALAPLAQAGVEVDVVQLSPIALANMVMFDQLPDPATVDPEKPPASIVLVSMGVDSTDLVITNGLRIWQRSMPIGGSSFTKALVQGMKLTFAKAEHLKRNAVRAEDPKMVFKVMRPVFNEFAAELQRSLNYFTGTDRTATIGKVLLLGNATKLRGLSDFVAKQLQLDVQRLESYRGLEGPAVMNAPAFRENRLAFGTAYGLALQGAGGASLRTNLLPREIVVDRLIEAKKPWAVGAMAGLLAAAAISFAGMFFAWTTYAPDLYAAAFAQADGVKGKSQAAITAFEEVKRKQDEAVVQQQYLLRVEDRRFQMLDMLRAVETLLPRDAPGKVPDNPADRQELHIEQIDCQYFPDLAVWFAGVKQNWAETHPAEESADEEAAGQNAAPPPADPAAAEGEPAAEAPAAAAAPAEVTGPTGPGWVIQMNGYHFHNEDHHKPDESAQFVRSTIVKGLLGEGDKVAVTAGPLAGQLVSVADLGIGFPVLVDSSTVNVVRVPRGAAPTLPGAQPQAATDAEGLADLVLRRFDFVLQFCWQPTVPGAPKPPPPTAAPAQDF
ncbi:MAG: type IV pilus assembly protein PilM [Planctomycetota bacterium]